MKTYTYRATIERGDETDWVVSFPDIPEAVTQAATIEDARHAAQDALGLALLSYPARGRPIPERSFVGEQAQGTDILDVDVAVAPDVMAKLAVLEAFHTSGRSRQDLGAILVKDDEDISRILDPMHPTDLQTLSDALQALGRRLVIGVTGLHEAA